MSEIVVFGTGSFAEVAFQYLSNDSEYEVVAFTADEEYVSDNSMFGIPVVPFSEITDQFPPEQYDMFVAITYTDLNRLRTRKYHEAKEKGYEMISYVASDSIVWENVEVGENCFIFENQTIQPFVEIGDNVILWSGNHVGHHSTIGDHCFVASHVVISGHVEIGEYSFLGVNATIGDGVEVANDCLIGAQALITDDTKEYGVYVGERAELLNTNSREML